MSSSEALLLPSIRATMGDWIYYIGIMPFREIASRVRCAEVVYKNRTLKERLQRALTRRSSDIAKYLRGQKQRFFNAVIVVGARPTTRGRGRASRASLPLLLRGAFRAGTSGPAGNLTSALPRGRWRA